MKEKEYHPNIAVRLLLKLKYNFLGKFIPGQRPKGEDKGFVIVQIDGVSHSVLSKAVGKGYMPNLKRLIKKRKFKLGSYFCPVPSNTPYAQAGLMYGNSEGIPGFRWVEKKSGRRITFKEASSASVVEKRISKNKTGILAGGSSYVNLFTGDAERSVFTLSTFAAANILRTKRISQLDIFFLFIVYIANLLRTTAYLFVDSILEFYEWLGLLISRKKRRGEGLFPLIRLINNVIIREIATVGAVTDVMRGVPSVHINFNGYDEISHHRGPEFHGSFRVLRGIDKKIGKIVRAVASCDHRDYDLYILSDHGQTPSTPFLHKYEETLASLLRRNVSSSLEVTEFNSPQEVFLHEGWKYMEEMATLSLNMPRLMYNLFEKVRGRLLKDKAQIIPFIWREEKEQVFVNDSGPLSHIYFNFKKEQISASEIRERYPDLIDALTNHPGIGTVIGRGDNGKSVLLKRDASLSEEENSSLLSLAGDQNSGDIIVQGAYDGEEIINFEEQLSGHGGIGGGQCQPFFLMPPNCGLDLASIKNPSDFYPFFFNNYTAKNIKNIKDAAAKVRAAR